MLTEINSRIRQGTEEKGRNSTDVVKPCKLTVITLIIFSGFSDNCKWSFSEH